MRMAKMQRLWHGLAHGMTPVSQQDISTPFSIRMKFAAIEFSYSIRYEILRIFDPIFDSNEMHYSSYL